MVCGVVWCVVWCGLVCGVVWCVVVCGVWCGAECGVVWCGVVCGVAMEDVLIKQGRQCSYKRNIGARCVIIVKVQKQ